MASTSSTPPARSIVSPKLYDVFISHRGPDVKKTLAKQLYDLLKARECKAFLDREEIEGGDSITFAIENGILSSRVQIAIFSEGYAESSWCLNELVLMLQQKDAVFIPVFYNVQPWELRHINNEYSQYAAAFSGYQQKRRNLDKLDEWKGALVSASNISGYELSHHQDNLCEKIVSRVVQVIEENRRNTHLHVAKYPVALDELVQDFEKCCLKTAGMVGIFGLGGSGKSTLVKELFNRKRSVYNASCFLSDVRESHARRELHRLQKQLLKDLLKKKEKIRSVDHGIGELMDHLGRARHLNFLIVLDDIDHEDQINALIPEGMLGSGTLIIITTRDQNMLRGADVLYKMKKMDTDHAKELFRSHAFDEGDIPAAYEKLAESFVHFCGGLPLSLKVLGAQVYRRDEKYWEQLLEKVKKIPPKDIMQRLRISFDGLDREEKQIFIDIACLFNKKSLFDLKSNAIIIWKASGWSAEYALQTLQDKCLIEVGYERFDYPGLCFDRFEMHDHLRDLGRQMADELGPPRLWRSELLRSMEAKGLKQLLAEPKGRCFGSFNWTGDGDITYFVGETGLLWLQIGGHSGGLPKPISIPSWIPLHKLHILNIDSVEELWSTFQQQLQINPQASFELRKLTIKHCPSLQKLPDLIGMFSHLEELKIIDSLDQTDATSLAQSIKRLSNLRSLQLGETRGGFFRGNFDLSKGRDSNNSDSFTSSRMDKLETIELFDLENISKLVISGEMCPRLRLLEVSSLGNLKEMELKNNLETIKLMRLENISKLVISGEMCPRLRLLKVSSLFNLEEMELKKLETLSTLDVYGCRQLEAISDLSTLTGLQTLTLKGCDGLLEAIPDLSTLKELQSLTLHRCDGLKWVNLAHLHRLQEISITLCRGLQSVEWEEELPGLTTLQIEIPDDGYASWVRNYVCGLKKLPVKKMIQIVFQQKEEMGELSSKLNANMFSEIVGEIGIEEYRELKISSASSAITIYALFVTPWPSWHGFLTVQPEGICTMFEGKGDSLITVVLTQHDIEGSLENVTVKKGIKVTMKVGEEGKALTVLQRIADRLYPQSTEPNLVASDMVKSKKRQKY